MRTVALIVLTAAIFIAFLFAVCDPRFFGLSYFDLGDAAAAGVGRLIIGALVVASPLLAGVAYYKAWLVAPWRPSRVGGVVFSTLTVAGSLCAGLFLGFNAFGT